MLNLELIARETPFPGENDLPRPVASKNAALFEFQSLGYMPGDTDRSFGKVGSTATSADSRESAGLSLDSSGAKGMNDLGFNVEKIIQMPLAG
jgi:hypothetical protein